MVKNLDPNTSQYMASDPHVCAWVEASAGSGKTKVLCQRVLRLLLKGVAPGRILCLTFTKAAAAQMYQRIFDHLSLWAVASSHDLEGYLRNVTDEPVDEKMKRQARCLFVNMLDASSGGLKIQTFHGFCQSLLQRFPLEADLSAHFEVMDEAQTQVLLKQAQDEVFLKAQSKEDHGLFHGVCFLTSCISVNRFNEWLEILFRQRDRFEKLCQHWGDGDRFIQDLFQKMNLKPYQTACELMAQEQERIFHHLQLLNEGIDILRKSGKSDQKSADFIAKSLSFKGSWTSEVFDGYMKAFLTQKGGKPDKFPSKKVQQEHPHFVHWIDQEQKYLQAFQKRQRNLEVVELTQALFVVTKEIFAHYQQLKNNLSCLDYDDLILRTRDLLLSAQDSCAWVLYKLDGGIDHLLIDEAQDTSPLQWDVIDILLREFQQGENACDKIPRTFFAVGDVKQSIYSFNDSDPAYFQHMRHHLQKGFESHGRVWKYVPMNISFRSVPAVLSFVDHVFQDNKLSLGVAFQDQWPCHLAYRSEHFGQVALWPLLEKEKKEKQEPWPLPICPIVEMSPQRKIAKRIAQTLKKWLSEKKMIPSQNRPIEPKDVMILVRRRSDFNDALVAELKDRNIPVGGMDRIDLVDHLAIRDLLSVGRFILLTCDDLNLAALLKSPLVGLGEEDVFQLCHGRKGSLWQQLCQMGRNDPQGLYGRAWHQLIQWLDRAHQACPFSFFYDILIQDHGYARLLNTLGRGIAEPVEAFLVLCQEYEREYTPHLQGFIEYFDRIQAPIKRNMDQVDVNEVRIMTVHSAKGLEAPVVFLADMASDVDKKSDQKPCLLWGENHTFYAIRKKEKIPDHLKPYLDEKKKLRHEEYHRLLYVALTRAQDHLVLCGWGQAKEASWHLFIENVMKRVGKPINENGDLLQYIFEDSCVQRAGLGIDSPHSLKQNVLQVFNFDAQLFERVRQMKVQQTFDGKRQEILPRMISPSLDQEQSQGSPFDVLDIKRFEQGKLIHHLLHVLPQYPCGQWHHLAKSIMAGYGGQLDDGQVSRIIDESLKVLRHPDFSHVFDAKSLSEVPVQGWVDNQYIKGIIDRLIIQDDQAIVVDFKTNQKVPQSPENIPKKYQRQISLYVQLIEKIYPHITVEAFIIWTHTCQMVKVEF